MSNNNLDENMKPKTDTNTNLLVSVLANSDKLIPKQYIHHYGEEDSQLELDDRIESCIDVAPDEPENNGMNSGQIGGVSNLGSVGNNHPGGNTQNDVVNSELTHNETSMVNNNGPRQVCDDDDEYDTATPVRKKLLKLNMIRKLTELVSKGVKLSQNYNMDSDYKTMKYECELHNSIREKHNTVRFLQDGCLTAIGALEKANKRFDPFGLNLNGWGDSVGSKTDQLYDAFGDLYEKWSGPGKSIPPEITLIGILGFSAAKTHWVNTSIDSIPSLDDRRKNDPNYIEKIRQQALGNTIIEQEKKQQTEFTEKLTKQYNEAMKQAQDYKKLREQEEEYRHTTPVPPIPTKSDVCPPSHVIASIFPSEMTEKQFRNFRDADIQKQREKFAKEHEKMVNQTIREKNIVTDESSLDSIIQMNPDINDILKSAETASNSHRPRGRKKKNTTL